MDDSNLTTKSKSPEAIPTTTLQMISRDTSTDQLDLIQEVNRLKLNPNESTTSQESQPTCTRSQIPSTSPTLLRPESRTSPPQIQQSRQLPISSTDVSTFKQSLAPQRIKFKRSGYVRSTKHVQNRNRVTQILLEHFRTGSSPYETIQKALTDLKKYINETSTNSVSSDTSNLDSTTPGTNAGCIMVEVTEMVEEYMNKISSRVSEEEIEEGLLSIQRRIGVDLLPTWFSLLSKSYMEFWESLNDQFECLDLKDRVDEEGGDQFGSNL